MIFARLQEQGRLCKAIEGMTLEYLAGLDGDLVEDLIIVNDTQSAYFAELARQK